MSSVPRHNIDLMTPPVVKTIEQRSLIIGLVFGVIAALGAWLRPDEFFRAYLMAFMAWLPSSLKLMVKVSDLCSISPSRCNKRHLLGIVGRLSL